MRCALRRRLIVFAALVTLAVAPLPAAAQLLINNGSAPPDPDNVIDVPSPDLLVRNAGCTGTGDCPAPGAATEVEVMTGGRSSTVDIFDGSELLVSGGAVGDPGFCTFENELESTAIFAHDTAHVEVTGGAVAEISLYGSTSLLQSGGTVGQPIFDLDYTFGCGGIRAEDDAIFDVTGGAVHGLQLDGSATGTVSDVGLWTDTGFGIYGDSELTLVDSWGSANLWIDGNASAHMEGASLLHTVGVGGTGSFDLATSHPSEWTGVGALSLGADAVATLSSGGIGGLELRDRSVATMTGGTSTPWAHCQFVADCWVPSEVEVQDDARFVLDGGEITSALRGVGSSRIEIRSGSVTHFEQGLEPDVELHGSSELLVEAGDGFYLLRLHDQAGALLAGGTFGEVQGPAGTTLVVSGSGFELDGAPVPLGELTTSGSHLTGTLANGDPLSLYLENGPWYWAAMQGSVHLVPEPGASGFAAGLVALTLLGRWRTRSSR